MVGAKAPTIFYYEAKRVTQQSLLELQRTKKIRVPTRIHASACARAVSSRSMMLCKNELFSVQIGNKKAL